MHTFIIYFADKSQNSKAYNKFEFLLLIISNQFIMYSFTLVVFALKMSSLIFCALPQIMFFNMWVSISGFNYEHYCRSKVILAGVVKGKSRMCCSSKGKSSLLSCLQFLGWLLGRVHFLDLLHFWNRLYFLVGLHFWGHCYFWCCLHFLGFKLLARHHFWGQNSAKCGQTGSYGTKWGETGPKGIKRGHMGPNRFKWDT